MQNYSFFLIILFFIGICNFTKAQSAIVPANSHTEYLMDRFAILSGGQVVYHPTLKPFLRHEAATLAISKHEEYGFDTESTQRDFRYLLNDNNEFAPSPDTADFAYKKREQPILKYFYQTPANFFELETPHFRLKLNPIFNFNLGREKGDDELVFLNQRGFELRGDIDNKVYFQSSLFETQVRLPEFYSEFVNQTLSVPGAGLYKTYDSRVFKITSGYDYNIADARVGFRVTKHIAFQFGHGRNTIGSGYRSMFLSDFSTPYFFVKFNTRVWKLNYQNLFMEINAISGNTPRAGGDYLVPKKFAALHYLSFDVRPNLSFGFFEATVFGRNKQFELQYLNPVILYRTVEGSLGSPDNVLIGLDGNWTIKKRVRLYGQLLLDEFYSKAIYKPEEKGWWGNKLGAQLGLKYVNAFGLKNLDVQYEFNTARPFTYAHRDSLTSYQHYNQPLAHPLGANFREHLVIARYRPIDRIDFTAKYFTWTKGKDFSGLNYGGNVLLDYDTRVSDYSNAIGQGAASNVQWLSVEASWRLAHNIYLDAKYLRRNEDNKLLSIDKSTHLFSGGIRINAWNTKSEL